MAHFAKINSSNIVEQVIVVDNKNTETEQAGKDFIAYIGLEGNWIQTSYSGSFRNKFAAVGDTYDEVFDVFIAPKPFNSWTLDNTTGIWHPPTPYPNDKNLYMWVEDDLNWQLITP